MFTNITEIILIIVIVLIVFGMGKLPSLATRIGRLRSEFNKGLDGRSDAIDITPSAPGKGRKEQRKPGKFKTSVEDATIEETSN